MLTDITKALKALNEEATIVEIGLPEQISEDTRERLEQVATHETMYYVHAFMMSIEQNQQAISRQHCLMILVSQSIGTYIMQILVMTDMLLSVQLIQAGMLPNIWLKITTIKWD